MLMRENISTVLAVCEDNWTHFGPLANVSANVSAIKRLRLSDRRGSATDWCADWSRWWGSKRVLADQGRGIVPGPCGTLDGGEGVKSL